MAGRPAAPAGAAGRPPAGADKGGDAGRLAVVDGRLRLRVRLRLLPLPPLPRRRRLPALLGTADRAPPRLAAVVGRRLWEGQRRCRGRRAGLRGRGRVRRGWEQEARRRRRE